MCSTANDRYRFPNLVTPFVLSLSKHGRGSLFDKLSTNGKCVMTHHLPKWWAFAAIFLLVLFVTLPQTGWSQTPKEAADQLVLKLYNKMDISSLEVEIASLTLEGTKASSPFADAFLGHVRDTMLRNYPKDFKQVTRRKVTTETVTRNRGFSKPNYTSEDEEVEDAVLEGTYREAADTLFVQLRLVKTDGSPIASAEVPVALDKITQEYKPAAVQKLKEEEDVLGNLLTQPQTLQVTANLSKGNGAIYKEKEQIVVHFQSEEDVYVRLIYRDVNGEIIPLYDSLRDFNRLLEGGKSHTIDTDGKYSWTVSCKDGCGPETLVVVASTSPLPPESTAYRWSLGDYVRGLQQQLVQSPGSPQTAVLTVSLTTVK